MNIKQANVVFEFDIDPNIMLTLGGQIIEIQKKYNCKVQQINAQKAPPDVPRIVIIFENYIINICLNRCEYIMQIPSHISNNINNCIDYVSNNISQINRYIAVDDRGYNWTGVIFHNEYPSQDKELPLLELITPLFDRMINIERNNRELSSFQLQFGFKEDDLFCNYTIGGYETRNIEVEIKPGNNVINVKKEEGKKIEQGVLITVDINDKPKIVHLNAIDDMNVIFSNIRSKLSKLSDTLNIRGVIDE